MEEFYRNKGFRYMIYLLLGLMILYMLWLIRPILGGIYAFLRAVLAPFIIAMIISYVLNPIVVLLNRRKVPRTVAVLLIYAVFLASLTVIMMNMIPMFMTQLTQLNENMPDFTIKAQGMIDRFNESEMLPDSVRSGINNSLYKLETGISDWVSNYINNIGDKIDLLFFAQIIPFVAFYILKDFQLIEKTVLAVVPKRNRRHVTRLLFEIDEALGNYIRGQFLVCIIIGFMAYVGYWLIDMPFPLLLASVVAVFNIIPYLGPYLGAAPAALMAASISWKMVLYVLLVNWLCQLLEGNVISPQVVGRTLHMHPLTIIFALLVGGRVAGVPGLILAVPLFAVMKVIFSHVSHYFIQRKTT
ncbi:AI-2E family transporter [Gorillibacterium sp. sgz5001074]|uniref:AI-2E family transporter n=1 Tax=Gorillibacterium sp. sgz5001074 TaxID=3446695 RepID=UPI003F665AD9